MTDADKVALTTRMLCNAVAAVGRGKLVFIVGYCQAHTRDLVRMARGMARTCGFDETKVHEGRNDPRHAVC